MFKPVKDLEEGDIFIMATGSNLRAYSVIKVCLRSIVVSCKKTTVATGRDGKSTYTYEVFEEDISNHNSTKRISTTYRLKDNVYIVGRVDNP